MPSKKTSKKSRTGVASFNPMAIDATLPHQIDAPDFKKADIPMQAPFRNEYGVIIGDSSYRSPESPLENWSTDVDPAVMAGKQWVHPTNDIGWNTPENRALIEKNKEIADSSSFQHPDKDVGYKTD